MAGQYQQISYSSLKALLAQDVNDPTDIFFTSGEKYTALRETIGLLNVLTGYFRKESLIDLSATEPWYDLTVEIPELVPTTLLGTQIGTMQERLMEPNDPSVGAGMSEMFSLTDLTNALHYRYNQFIADTELVIERLGDIQVSAGLGLVPLDQTTIKVVRAVWVDSEGVYHNLVPPGDESTAVSFAMVNSWRQAPGVPITYSFVNSPNLNMQLIPPPLNDGVLKLFVVANLVDIMGGDEFTALNNIPDDLQAGPLWGALADLLSKDGIAHDPVRAEFCRGMYSLYVDIAKSLPLVLGVAINNVFYQPSSVSMTDRFISGWEGQTTDTPKRPILMGDWLGFQPVPDDAYQASVQYVRSAEIPANTGDFVNIAPELLTGICMWAKQLLMFKKQGVQLKSAQAAAGLLIDQCRRYNEIRISQSSYLSEAYGRSNDLTANLVRQTDVQSNPTDDPRDTASTRQSRSSRSDYKPPRRRLGGR